MTRTWPDLVIITLSGLKSRWTRPAACAATSPRPAATVDVQHLAPATRVCASNPVAEGVPLDELHRDEHRFAEGADVEHHDDVRVRQARDGLRLAQQARAAVRVVAAAARPQELERDLAIQVRIVRGVDLAHAPPAQQAQHDVAADGGALREPEFLGRRRARALRARRPWAGGESAVPVPLLNAAPGVAVPRRPGHAQLALAWLLAQRPFGSPSGGARPPELTIRRR